MPNYRRGAFDFVIDSSFQPFSMSEMLAPLTLYKEAFEKSEEAYTDLKTKADVFKDLSASLPENSKARQIYEGYANDLNSQAEDLARNGLNMGNRRALTSLKQRYSGEIGQLDRAKTKLEEVLKTRQALEASGKRRLYAENNFTIDDFLDGNTPNMYGVDPDVLYAKGAQRGKSVSSRMADIKEGGSMVNGYFRDVIQSTGMDPQKLNRWMQSDEFNKMVDLAMLEEGVAQNLRGMDYLRAKQAYISGIFDGVAYTEKHDLQRDLDVLDPSQKNNIALGWANHNLQAQSQALQIAKFQREMEEDDIRRELLYERDPQTGKLKYRDGMAPPGWVRDPVTGRLVRDYSETGKSGSGRGSSEGTTRKPQLTEKIRLQWKGDNPNDENGDEDDRMAPPQVLPDDIEEYAGEQTPYSALPTYVRKKIDNAIGKENGGDPALYTFYYKKYKRGGLWGALNDTETVVDIVPVKLEIDNAPQIPNDYATGSDIYTMLPNLQKK